MKRIVLSVIVIIMTLICIVNAVVKFKGVITVENKTNKTICIALFTSQFPTGGGMNEAIFPQAEDTKSKLY